ncbi:HAD-IIIA family hydrolase [Clostridium estertheticum]|uniref:HAD-IIIA family hydrolase n=1 Tax=Clostridium estertheticum TaxID=238834 RepID=UPI001CF32C35|nr:HAD-IIIA family hydrolase [Clostridium estertheticum]MCB2359692.1 HAD-IIIA family hydrolase [Clostridium estertheticum]
MDDLKKVQAVFIDRDGTMGGDTDVTYPDKFVLYPFTDKAIKMLKMNGIRVFAFTNQPGISAGEATEEDFVNELKEFGIEKAYICPHTPEHNCKCRKPEAGLLLKAKAEYGLDLSRCFVIGDRWRDMMAAKRANMGKILVLTGAGNETLGKDRDRWSQIEPDYVANNVLEAAQWIVEKSF